MERLTERSGKYGRVNGTRLVFNIEEQNEKSIMERAIARLAAYEDTEMSPEGIIKALKTLGLFTEATKGIPLNRIRELAQAEQDGRLKVLPCKVGDQLFSATCGKIRPFIVAGFELYGDTLYIAEQVKLGREYRIYGKTAFSTREEAEAALKGGAEPPEEGV